VIETVTAIGQEAAMETVVVDGAETVARAVMETVVVDGAETGAETVVVGDENAMRIAIAAPNGRTEVPEKARMSETDREEMNKKSPTGRGKDLAVDRETETATVRTKIAKDAMVPNVPASIAVKDSIPNPTTTPLPLTRKPMRPPIKSRVVLVSSWRVSSEANRLATINPEGDAIKWKFSGFAVVLP